MGFRSNFITEDMRGVEVPRWFVEKYPDHRPWHNAETDKYYFPIVQPWESKFYRRLDETEVFKDIQKILQEHPDKNWSAEIALILLHECGGITRVKITRDSITGREPTAWKEVENVEHDYCYGCSDAPPTSITTSSVE